MKRTRTKPVPVKKLSEQVEKKVRKKTPNKKETNHNQIRYDGDNQTISTGSTLLDLAISGGRFREGGIPLGIFVEIFGPSGTGKTVLLSQIAGNIQRAGGKVMFHDPEARLNKQFAAIFGLKRDKVEYTQPDTIQEVFNSVREWIPQVSASPIGVFADSLAALSTDLELGSEEGDKMGMRRAKEFSQELRKTCRILTQRNVLMICSNQIRQSGEAYGPRYKSPGGEAIAFYASLRLRCFHPDKIKVKRKIHGREHERVVGVKVEIEVFKSSVWKPYHSADVYIIYDYGIDDTRANLQFLKSCKRDTVYRVGGVDLGKAIGKAVIAVEREGLVRQLKDEVIDLWNEIEEKFEEKRKPREWY